MEWEIDPVFSLLEKVIGNDQIAKLLINNGARLTQLKDFAFIESVSMSLMQCMVKNFPLFVLQRDKSGNTPLHIAARRGDSPLVKYLIEQAPQCLLLKNSKGEMPIDSLSDQFTFQSDYKKEENRVKKIFELTRYQIHSQVKKPKKPIVTWNYSAPAYIQYADYVGSQGGNSEAIIPGILSADMGHSDYDVLLECLRSLMPLLPWARNPDNRASVYEIRNLNEKESDYLVQHLKFAFLGYPVRIAAKKQIGQSRNVFYQVQVSNLSVDLLQLAARQLLQNPILVIKDADFMENLFPEAVWLLVLLPYLDMFDYANEEAFKCILLNCGVPVSKLNKYIEEHWQSVKKSLSKEEAAHEKKLISQLRRMNSENGESEFYKAIESDDFWLYKACIHEGHVSIDQLNGEYFPVIFRTIEFGSLAIIRDAIAAGAALGSVRAPDLIERNSHIFFKGGKGDYSGYSDNYYSDMDPLCEAARQGKYVALKLLVAAGMNVNNLSLKDCYLETPLQALVKKGELEPVQFIVESGAALNYNTEGYDAALSIAIRECYYRIARYLINQGAEINKITSKREKPCYIYCLIRRHPFNRCHCVR